MLAVRSVSPTAQRESVPINTQPGMTLMERLSGAVQHTAQGLSPKCRARKSSSHTSAKTLPPRRPEHQQWVRLQIKGDVPSPRSGHDVAVVNNKVYLFGGCGGENDAINCLNDMYTFDLDRHTWDLVKCEGDVTPSARASFGMCAGPTPNTLIIAGGTGVEMDSLRSDVMDDLQQIR